MVVNGLRMHGAGAERTTRKHDRRLLSRDDELAIRSAADVDVGCSRSLAPQHSTGRSTGGRKDAVQVLRRPRPLLAHARCLVRPQEWYWISYSS